MPAEEASGRERPKADRLSTAKLPTLRLDVARKQGVIHFTMEVARMYQPLRGC